VDVSSLRKEIVELQEKIRPQLSLDEDHHERLFEVFRKIANARDEGNSGGKAGGEDGMTASLVEAGTVVSRIAAALPARCMRDLLYKLAIWRWDTPNLEQPVEDVKHADAIAYSAFLDLSKMLGARDVLKDFDKASQR
jgi:hypothetical protein